MVDTMENWGSIVFLFWVTGSTNDIWLSPGFGSQEKTDVFRVHILDSYTQPIVEGHGNMHGH